MRGSEFCSPVDSFYEENKFTPEQVWVEHFDKIDPISLRAESKEIKLNLKTKAPTQAHKHFQS